MNPYKHPDTAAAYRDYLASENGRIQKQVLGDAILAQLTTDNLQLTLDAACGNGWLSKTIFDSGLLVQGYDSSKALLDEARGSYPNLKFTEADAEQPLPYPEDYFSAVVLNMAITDVSDVAAVFKHLRRVLKPYGKLIVTLPNPEYTYPVGVWKRGIIGALLGRKPKLLLRPKPQAGAKIDEGTFSTFWRPLENYIHSAAACGLTLDKKIEIKSKTDSPKFDLNYQLFRYPLLLLLGFEKNNSKPYGIE